MAKHTAGYLAHAIRYKTKCMLQKAFLILVCIQSYKRSSKVFLFILPLSLSFLFPTISSFGQKTLETQIDQIAKKINGHVGVCVLILETGKTISYHGDKRFPMQSVYKFPIAMAVLNQVDEGNLALDQNIHIDTSEYIPKSGYSPIRDKFPGGTNLTVKEILRYNIEESDGTACDVLLRLLGGTKNADQYVHHLGVKDISISTTEKVQVANDTIQYQNWTTPIAMTKLLGIFYNGKNLSGKSRALLLKYMIESGPGANRIKGLLPEGTIVAHKTGTANTINGLTRATNDVGIITLPDGKHLAISVFISDAYASGKKRELTIAKISRAAFDYYKNLE